MITSCAKRQLHHCAFEITDPRRRSMTGIQQEFPFKGPGAFKMDFRIIYFLILKSEFIAF